MSGNNPFDTIESSSVFAGWSIEVPDLLDAQSALGEALNEMILEAEERACEFDEMLQSAGYLGAAKIYLEAGWDGIVQTGESLLDVAKVAAKATWSAILERPQILFSPPPFQIGQIVHHKLSDPEVQRIAQEAADLVAALASDPETWGMLQDFAYDFAMATHHLEYVREGTGIAASVVLALLTSGLGAAGVAARATTTLAKVGKILVKVARYIKKGHGPMRERARKQLEALGRKAVEFYRSNPLVDAWTKQSGYLPGTMCLIWQPKLHRTPFLGVGAYYSKDQNKASEIQANAVPGSFASPPRTQHPVVTKAYMSTRASVPQDAWHRECAEPTALSKTLKYAERQAKYRRRPERALWGALSGTLQMQLDGRRAKNFVATANPNRSGKRPSGGYAPDRTGKLREASTGEAHLRPIAACMKCKPALKKLRVFDLFWMFDQKPGATGSGRR